MILIERKHIDILRWDSLVKLQSKNAFSQSRYLDACAENWCILVDKDYSQGIALPYTIRIGVKTLYTPYFVRYIEWLGQARDSKIVLDFLKKQFKVADFNVKSLYFGGIQKTHQYLIEDQLKISENAKRMLKKAQQYPVFQEVQLEKLMELISTELTKKVSTLNQKSLPLLSKLAQTYTENGLIQFNIYDENELAGAAWFLETDQKIMYLKGACSEAVKKNGGMYRLLFEGISLAFSKEKIMDFGGSNVSSVKEFNQKFGARDALYGQIRWNNAPWWWKIAKAWKQK